VHLARIVTSNYCTLTLDETPSSRCEFKKHPTPVLYTACENASSLTIRSLQEELQSSSSSQPASFGFNTSYTLPARTASKLATHSLEERLNTCYMQLARMASTLALRSLQVLASIL